MAKTPKEMIDMDAKQLAAFLQRAEQGLEDRDFQRLQQLTESYAYLTQLVADKDTTIESLRQLFAGKRSEKTSAVLGGEGGPQSKSSEDPAAADEELADEDDKPPPPGHGRNGANDYPGADRVKIPHKSLQSGDDCPNCGAGTVYQTAPGVLLRFTGQPPLNATVYELQKLRCNLCGQIFTAEAPDEAGGRKYDATAASMIGLLKYGTGMPFNRSSGLQRGLGIPLPPSTQWEIVHRLAGEVTPVYEALVRAAAQADVMHVDDTSMRILELMNAKSRRQILAGDDTAERTGLFTSGVVTTCEKRHIALFFSGPQHAGENLRDLLRQRAAELPPPIQMCDALSRNTKGELATIVANCLTHGRRNFVNCHGAFPDECSDVILSLKGVYKNDALTKGMLAEERLAFHQRESLPLMNNLHQWLERQFDQRLVEPNSQLGGAIKYMLKHWDKLTLFLRQPGAPLDNNICERALKRIIIHRKNSLFYKTRAGALVGDCLMSLIYTSELNGARPFEYLTSLQQHAASVHEAPEQWLPWNYHLALPASAINAA
jgi:transposase